METLGNTFVVSSIQRLGKHCDAFVKIKISNLKSFIWGYRISHVYFVSFCGIGW
jgi:hypothetical protein